MDREPPRPPDTYDPSFGSVLEYQQAVLRHARYWQQHPHGFVPCTQHARCPDCFECGLSARDIVHRVTP